MTTTLSTEAATELTACAWALVEATTRMRQHWAELSGDERYFKLWVPVHTAADTLRARLEIVTCEVCHGPTDTQPCDQCHLRADLVYTRSQDR